MLHQKTDTGNTDPTDEAHNNWFATGFDQLDNVGIKTNRCHGKYDQKFAQSFKRSKCVCWNAKVYGNCCNNRGKQEVKDEKWKYFLEIYFLVPFCLSLMSTDKCQNQCDWDNGKCTGQFHSDSFIQSYRTKSIHGGATRFAA